MNSIGAVDRKIVPLAQRQQPGYRVHIATGQNDAGNWRGTHALARVQAGRGFDLLAQVRRCVEQEPSIAVGADGNGCLRAWPCMWVAGTGSPAGDSVRIPLREAAAGGGTEHARLHGSDPAVCCVTATREERSFPSGTGARASPGFSTPRDGPPYILYYIARKPIGRPRCGQCICFRGPGQRTRDAVPVTGVPPRESGTSSTDRAR